MCMCACLRVCVQVCNQTFLEGGSKPGMVTQMISKWGPLLAVFYSMLMLGVYLRLNMGYCGECNYLNKVSSLLLDLCCLHVK